MESLFMILILYSIKSATCNALEFNGQEKDTYDVEIDYYTGERKFIELERPASFNIKSDSSFSTEYDDIKPLDSWSVVWYVASFGGLVAFFIVVSCSEWCCRRHARSRSICQRRCLSPQHVSETPPPSYEHFAPPSYESICIGKNGQEKSEYDVYVVPVHALNTMMESLEDAPPSYNTANQCLKQQKVLDSDGQSCSGSSMSVTLPKVHRGSYGDCSSNQENDSVSISLDVPTIGDNNSINNSSSISPCIPVFTISR